MVLRGECSVLRVEFSGRVLEFCELRSFDCIWDRMVRGSGVLVFFYRGFFFIVIVNKWGLVVERLLDLVVGFSDIVICA